MQIPYGRQNLNEDDIQAVVDVLKSDYLTQGPIVPKFEKAVASYCQAKFAVAVNSATSALHIACLALDVGPGDVVWTSPVTFVASSNCALYCGASVDFVDIDPQTYNMSISALTKKLEQAEKDGTLPKVVIPVHLCGQSCEMQAIHTLAQTYGFKIIEDASHAIGGRYQGTPVGSCTYSDVTVFSFHPVKILTSGEGGMALTNDETLSIKLANLRSHGITRSPSEMSKIPDGPWYYEQTALGFNYRMTEIHAALGLSQMSRLDEFVSDRHAIVEIYRELFAQSDIPTPFVHSDVSSSFHLYVVRVPPAQRLEAFKRLRDSGIGANVHYIPVYRQPYYAAMGFDLADFPNAEAYYAEAITLPIFPGLTREHQTYVVEKLLTNSGFQSIF